MRTAVHALTPVATLLALAFAAAPALAQTTDTQELERVTVTLGRGQIRSVQGLTKADFEAAAAAGQSPLATVSRLPGVNFQSADPLGNYEWSTRFTVRAFSQNQLGFTLDGVPLGDMSYGNLNGLHISRAISSENVARAELSQGTGALDTPSSSNLGGTLQFFSADPAKAFGLQASQTLGSDSNSRTFLRLDSGSSELGAVYLDSFAKGKFEGNPYGWTHARIDVEHGAVVKVEIVNSSPKKLFDEQAIAMMKSWRFPSGASASGCFVSHRWD